ncbi:hypothetical protein [Deferrisoma camini]|uniref:hypothetical protein n=1 Tax=Deferrisoma camini TaxID=1035120 RepID=UPI00046D7B63|nr:hypothetical protein [Deferrisoma camini]
MNRRYVHVLFVLVCAGVLFVLFRAPPVSTPRLPPDATHANRKAYEACPSCHGRDSETAMPEDHLSPAGPVRPDHLKCYFCHKPTET